MVARRGANVPGRQCPTPAGTAMVDELELTIMRPHRADLNNRSMRPVKMAALRAPISLHAIEKFVCCCTSKHILIEYHNLH